MKSFLLKILAFTLFLFSICLLLSEIEFSDDFLINRTKDTAYDKVGWNLSKIKNYKEEIKGSNIFFGSSYVLNGLSDSVLNTKKIKSFNFAVRHNGNDLSLFFLKKIVPLQPKEVFFLKGKTGFKNLHKLAPLLYKPSTLVGDGQAINISFVNYLFKRTKLALEYIFFITENNQELNLYSSVYGIEYENEPFKETIFNEKNIVKKLRFEDEGYNLHKTNYLYKKEKTGNIFLNTIKTFKRKVTREYYQRNNWVSNWKSQENFVNKAKEICEENNVPFSQLYMPVVSDVVSIEKSENPFFIPLHSDAKKIYVLESYTFLKNRLYWADMHHLSKKGAIVFTNKLAEQFK
ncbi:hypothetical protein [uncultured Maribacter sp.]|uniref:hypothetical protein n=1 Tax=uncultured Maribacter sp. TaxID=431308 RepID=UPI00260D894D|nr:hypothetical protein [uncultured Maribacter sp.]